MDVHRAERQRKQFLVLFLKSCLYLLLFRDQVLEVTPRNEEQIEDLMELEAEEHLQVSLVEGFVS